ncbi:amidohydrolase [Arenibacter sp. GZD96]|uniref:amidohydrolase n=1 Tax=Aurantibrevibacter litoralis TaxID=3106030 RepID=UPI002AFE99AB|nr:amidohydrolase [Arenibacter sp. GZD-96]MEA1785844.1 amidohydrolase [Arenibacter sp. GZD-96]
MNHYKKIMQNSNTFLILLASFICITALGQQKVSKNKRAVIASVEKHQENLIHLSDQIWAFAETALLETNSAQVLADYAEKQGFRVQRGVAEMPTAFIAEYGSGKPIIGIMGEYDALPGLSQKALPTKEPLHLGAPGHGCGHNMFGPGSLGAAVAIKELIAEGKLKGTIRFYGTPAEEDLAGKVYMGRAGLFDDLDVCLDWHPDYENKAGIQSSQSVSDYTISFRGKSAHAASDPWNGRSALDAAEFFTDGINSLREHVRPSVRMHYVYSDGGKIPNVIPDEAAVWLWIRDSKRSGVAEVTERMREIAKGAALMAGVEYDIQLNNGLYEILVNETGAKVLQKNMEIVGPITYTQEELDFADTLMENYGLEKNGINGKIQPLDKTKEDPEGGSTDVGDVSYIVPEISLLATTAPHGSPWHSWVVVASGGMSIGHKGMLFAAKTLGATMVDLFENEKLRTEIRAEFVERKGTEVWEAMLPPGPPPIPQPRVGTK